MSGGDERVGVGIVRVGVGGEGPHELPHEADADHGAVLPGVAVPQVGGLRAIRIVGTCSSYRDVESGHPFQLPLHCLSRA